MTVVLVHGNPETAAVWGPLLTELGHQGYRDVVCLSPPGFGAVLPAGFGATVTEYREWLIGELEGFGGPVDLVGHDWGGGHVLGAVMARPELVSSWASDVVGIFDPDYIWHDLAQQWQTPTVGEQAVAAQFAGPLPDRVERLVGRGITRPVAEQIAVGQDEAMGRAVLALYRSAAQPVLADLGRGLGVAAQRPGLALLATQDYMVGTDEQRRRAAARAGARVEVFDGLGHWWMVQDPVRAAHVLTTFWANTPHPTS